jgi:hypothetical protein
MPSPSDFTSGGDHDALWYVFLPNGVQKCSTSGMSFVGYLQQILGIDQTLVWGATMSAALVSALQAAGADPAVIQGVQTEAASQQVGAVTLTAAIWVMQNYAPTGTVPQNISLNQISLPTTTVPPTWGMVSESTASGAIGPPTCAADEASVGGAPPVPTTNVTATTGGNAMPVPDSARAVIYQGGSSITWGLVAVLAVGAGIAWWLTRDMTKKSARYATTRRNPTSRRRPRRRALYGIQWRRSAGHPWEGTGLSHVYSTRQEAEAMKEDFERDAASRNQSGEYRIIERKTNPIAEDMEFSRVSLTPATSSQIARAIRATDRSGVLTRSDKREIGTEAFLSEATPEQVARMAMQRVNERKRLAGW